MNIFAASTQIVCLEISHRSRAARLGESGEQESGRGAIEEAEARTS